MISSALSFSGSVYVSQAVLARLDHLAFSVSDELDALLPTDVAVALPAIEFAVTDLRAYDRLDHP